MIEFGEPFAVPRLRPHQIAAITGHASLKEIVRYTNTVTGRGSRVPRGETGTSIFKP